MTRKHFKAIAKVIHDATFNDENRGITKDVVLRDELIEGLAKVFKTDNPRFDSNKFFAACIDGA